jgi:hypothetical protein
LTPEGHKGFIHKLVLLTSIEFKVSYEDLFSIKGGIIHSISSLSFAHYYSTIILINFCITMRGNISKEMAKRMKRMENFNSKLGGN